MLSVRLIQEFGERHSPDAVLAQFRSFSLRAIKRMTPRANLPPSRGMARRAALRRPASFRG